MDFSNCCLNTGAKKQNALLEAVFRVFFIICNAAKAPVCLAFLRYKCLEHGKNF